MRPVFYLHRLIASVLMCFSYSSAYAGIGGIGNAQVDEGKFTNSLRSAYMTDSGGSQDGRWRSRIMTDYGFNDWFASGIYFQMDDRKNTNTELEAIIWDNRFEFTSANEDGFYSGIRLRYTWRDGDKKPDDAHIRLILGAPYGKWDFRINQILGVEAGAESRAGLLVETRPQITYGYYENHRMGIESFSNFGNTRFTKSWDNQSHDVGPVFQGPLTDTMNYELGYRRGISDAAANNTFRLFLIQSF